MADRFADALYTSRFRVRGAALAVLPLIVLVFALVFLLIVNGEKGIDAELAQKLTTICLIIIGASLVFATLAIVGFVVLAKRMPVCLAIYPSYMLIAAGKKLSEPLVELSHSQITSYSFVHDTSASARDSIHDISTSSNTFTYKHNTGRLVVEAHGRQFRADIGNIGRARELLRELVAVKEAIAE